jgi:hypothetical protein
MKTSSINHDKGDKLHDKCQCFHDNIIMLLWYDNHAHYAVITLAFLLCHCGNNHVFITSLYRLHVDNILHYHDKGIIIGILFADPGCDRKK